MTQKSSYTIDSLTQLRQSHLRLAITLFLSAILISFFYFIFIGLKMGFFLACLLSILIGGALTFGILLAANDIYKRLDPQHPLKNLLKILHRASNTDIDDNKKSSYQQSYK